MCFYQEIIIRAYNNYSIVDDLNLIRTPKELTKTTNYLKKEFKMKDSGKT